MKRKKTAHFSFEDIIKNEFKKPVSRGTVGKDTNGLLWAYGVILKDGLTLPANTGDVLISDISEPHGIVAISDMRVIVTIAPRINGKFAFFLRNIGANRGYYDCHRHDFINNKRF